MEIATFRRRRRDPATGRPWSQEELAFACGTGQAHISRIESGRQLPEYTTLIHICGALQLAKVDRAYLLALAGYNEALPLPDAETARAVLAKLRPVIDTYPYPASVIDEGERIWQFNQLGGDLWSPSYGTTSLSNCMAVVQGHPPVELLFDPQSGPIWIRRWQTYYANLGYALDRNVTLLWRAYQTRSQDVEMSQLVAKLMLNQDFRSRWEKIEIGLDDALFPDHARYVIRQPSLGTLTFNVFRTRASIDDRFIVCHHLPADLPTMITLEHLIESDSFQ